MTTVLKPTDEEFYSVGLTKPQVDLLADWDNEMRQEVYNEAIRLLMERPSGEDNINYLRN